MRNLRENWRTSTARVNAPQEQDYSDSNATIAATRTVLNTTELLENIIVSTMTRNTLSRTLNTLISLESDAFPLTCFAHLRFVLTLELA